MKDSNGHLIPTPGPGKVARGGRISASVRGRQSVHPRTAARIAADSLTVTRGERRELTAEQRRAHVARLVF